MGSEGVGEDRGREGSWGGRPRDAVTGRRIVSAASALESGFSRRTQWVDEPGSYAATEQGQVEEQEVSVLGSVVEVNEERDDQVPILAEGRSIWLLSPVSKNVVKCVVAYFLAELFTFVPALAEGIGAPFDADGPVRNAHVIATVAVYFNPAKTIGAMIEADLFMLVGAAYSVFLCCGSMAMTVFLDGYGLERLAHVLVLVFWLGCGFAVLAYVKVKVNKPALTTACSMVSLISSVIITKEGAFHIGHFQSQAILQIIIIVLIGTAISNVVCFTLWASSATTKLQGDLNKTLDSFSTLLGMLTKTFLLEDDITTPPSHLKSAIDAHQSSFTTLQSSLAQAKYEFLDSRLRNTAQAYDEAVKSMTRLAQGLTGMRSGCTLQYDLMRAALEGEERGDERIVLDKFKERVGETLRVLSRTSQRTLALLRTSFSRAPDSASFVQDDLEDSPLSSESLLSLKRELEQSLTLFKRAHSRAIKILYRRLPAKTMYEGKDPFADPEAFRKAVGGDEGPNDKLFRIYYYCFNFEEWVKELACLVETFVEIRSTEEEVERLMTERRRKWGVLARLMKGWGGRTRGRKGRTLAQRVAGVNEMFSGLTKRSKPQNPFPKIVDGALTSHQVPASELSFVGQVKYGFWRLGWHMRQPNLRFAIKTGAGVAVLASAAFIPGTRPLWLGWRGEWALISYMVIMAPTLGGTNFLALGRILGTFVGAGAAVTLWTVFPENSVMLPIMGALFSVPCFYVVVTRPQYGPSSRFVLLTFNLTCLYAFNLREIDTHVFSIAFHRSLAVAFGVAWGLVVTSYIWPFEARRELRKGLSEFFLNSAHLYETLVRTYSTPPPALSQIHTRNPSCADRECLNERSPLLLTAEAQKHLSDVAGDFVEMEVYLQLSLIKLSGLLDSTKHEPRLKGPFPIATYRNVLTSCQSILDLLTSMRTVTTREAWYTTVRRDFVIPVNRERREMVGNVLLYLSLLASALSLKTPLPAYLPPAAEARDRLVTKLRSLPIVQKRIVRGGSEGLLYLAYALTMKDVIAQLDSLGKTFQLLFGVIGGVNSKDEFEALFITHEEEGTREETDSEGSESSPDTEGERRTQ